VLPLAEAKALFRGQLLDTLRHGVGEVDRIIRAQARAIAVKKLLHMSDLHFGKPEAARRRSYLKGHLADVLRGIDRVVITGDMFDSPDGDLKGEFDEFRSDIERMTNKELIIVPGNHDVRTRGNAFLGFGKNFEQIAELRWRPVVIDDDLSIVFYCFNSAEGGDFARGLVSEQQRLFRATEFDRLRARAPRIDGYLKVALVHHHPYDYATHPTALYEKVLSKVQSKLYRRQDVFVGFDNADQFLTWCAGRGVSLILHGHKHVPHQRIGYVAQTGRRYQFLVIGCGSTTGVENTPMCYDVIHYDPASRRWGATFYHDIAADGGGFILQTVTIDTRPSSEQN